MRIRNTPHAEQSRYLRPHQICMFSFRDTSKRRYRLPLPSWSKVGNWDQQTIRDTTQRFSVLSRGIDGLGKPMGTAYKDGCKAPVSPLLRDIYHFKFLFPIRTCIVPELSQIPEQSSNALIHLFLEQCVDDLDNTQEEIWCQLRNSNSSTQCNTSNNTEGVENVKNVVGQIQQEREM